MKQKILIVDDLRENLIVLAKTLARLEIEVVTAPNGREALEACARHEFALAILDIEMPDMNGYELAERLRQNAPTARLPVIFFTGACQEEAQRFQGYESGAVDYIIKPCPAYLIQAKVRVFLDLDRQRLEILRHREHLEELVRERTAELEQMHALARQDAATKSELLKEVNHRVKNNLTAILGLLLHERRHAPASARAFIEPSVERLTQRIRGLLLAHQMLSNSQWAPMPVTTLAGEVIRAALAATPTTPAPTLTLHASPLRVSPRQASSLALVLNELATNSVKHCPPHLPLALQFQAALEDDHIRMEYRDNGPGYPEASPDPDGSHIGLILIRQLVTETLRGTLDLSNDRGAVATFRIRIEDNQRT